MKCNELSITKVRSTDPLCRNCFLDYCIHKFRVEFGKSCIVRDQENVCVAFSGGLASTSMLHLIETGLSKRSQKKLRFLPHVLLIDETAWYQCANTDDVCVLTSDMITALKMLKQPCYILGLEQVYESDINPVTLNEHSSVSHAPNRILLSEKLQALIKKLQNVTVREYVLVLLRNHLLAQCARKLGMSKVLLGNSQQCQAARMLSYVMQGRGHCIPHEMGFIDDRLGDISFLKPMREFAAEEIDAYNLLNDLKPLQKKTVQVQKLTSFDALANNFVTGLQGEFHNTINNICRMGEKLEVNCSSEKSLTRCSLCKAMIVTSICAACERIIADLGETNLLPESLLS